MFAWKTKPTDLQNLFNALGSNSSEKRYQALLEAMDLTPEQLTAIVEMATRRGRNSLWLNRTKRVLGVLVVGAPFLSSHTPIAFATLTLFSLLGVMVCVSAELDPCLPPTHWHTENLIRLLEMRSERRCVGAVLLLLEKAEGEQCDRLLQLLLRLLPELQADDAREWNARHRELLLRILRSWHKNRELADAVLRAMPEIGGTWALESVERLAKLEHWHADRFRANYGKVRMESLPWPEPMDKEREPTPEDVDAMLDAFRQIGIVAAGCLPELRAKIQAESAAQTLLRAVPAESPTEELLRPAAENELDTTNLLRPGTAPEEIILTHRQ